MVQQGFIVRGRNIGTSIRLPFVDEAQGGQQGLTVKFTTILITQVLFIIVNSTYLCLLEIILINKRLKVGYEPELAE